MITEVIFSWDLEDSPVGAGTINVRAKASEAYPLVELRMRWMGECEQPEVWEIDWVHHPDYLLTELPQYLLSYCPVGVEMIEVLKNLGLEKFPVDEEVAE